MTSWQDNHFYQCHSKNTQTESQKYITFFIEKNNIYKLYWAGVKIKKNLEVIFSTYQIITVDQLIKNSGHGMKYLVMWKVYTYVGGIK